LIFFYLLAFGLMYFSGLKLFFFSYTEKEIAANETLFLQLFKNISNYYRLNNI